MPFFCPKQQWIENYVATLFPEADAGSIDLEATRLSLLSERPIDMEKTKKLWSSSQSETGAAAFLKDYRGSAQKKLLSLEKTDPTEEEKETMSELEAILSVSYEDQLQKLVSMGTLRAVLDEYAPGSEREAFFEQYTPIFLEGMELEHLVDEDLLVGQAE